jgi:hypothetical protein
MKCMKCNATGQCQTCKGSGRSGYFLVDPGKSAKRCWRCYGSCNCDLCQGKGEVAEDVFRPYIYVEHSLRIPTSITTAAFTGATWRFIKIPERVLRRETEAQRGWVAWRVRRHFRENNGECFLFGAIVGYRWQRESLDGIRFDTRGKVIGMAQQSFMPSSGSLTVRNKTLSVSREGTLKITATGDVT